MAKTDLEPYWALYKEALDAGDVQGGDEVMMKIKSINARDAVPGRSSPFVTGSGSGMNRVAQDIYGLGVGAGELMGSLRKRF